MEPDTQQQEREVRAARNQSLFRAVNEQMRGLDQVFATVTETFTIACECADTNCLEKLEIHPHEYLAVRSEPRQFAVLPGHVYPDVETVVRESYAYVVVEKFAAAGAVAELMAPERAASG